MRVMNVQGQQNLSIACSPISQVQIMTEAPSLPLMLGGGGITPVSSW